MFSIKNLLNYDVRIHVSWNFWKNQKIGGVPQNFFEWNIHGKKNQCKKFLLKKANFSVFIEKIHLFEFFKYS